MPKFPAWMLPTLPPVVPLKTEFGQSHCDLLWLFALESNPNPFANDFSQFEKFRRDGAKQPEKMSCAKRSVQTSLCEIDSRQRFVLFVQVFGTDLESEFKILIIHFHGLFFVLLFGFGLSPFTDQAAPHRSSVGVVFRGHHETPMCQAARGGREIESELKRT